MKTFLKVKIKSLAEEARIIKLEERRWLMPKLDAEGKHIPDRVVEYEVDGKKRRKVIKAYRRDHPLRMSLRHHRIDTVRKEARASLLAYGFLRGRAYRRLEDHWDEKPNWRRVEDLVKKYSPEDSRVVIQRLHEWIVS